MLKTPLEYMESMNPVLASNDLVDEMIAIAKQQLKGKVPRLQLNYAIALLVCHRLTLMDVSKDSTSITIGGTTVKPIGGVASLKEGDLAVSFGSAGKASTSASLLFGDFGETTWGQILNGLLLAGAGPFVAVTGVGPNQGSLWG
jgi:hypothetical protein